MKYISDGETIIIYPKFNKPFDNEHIDILLKFDKIKFNFYITICLISLQNHI